MFDYNLKTLTLFYYKMSNNNYEIVINNKRIYDFYNSNPSFNIETINLIILDLLENIGSDVSKGVVNSQIIELINNVRDIRQQVNNLNDAFTSKLHEHNREFLDNLKLIISVSSNDNTEKVMQLLNKTTETFVDKINLSIPRTQEETYKRFQDNFALFQKNINEDIRNFLYSSHHERDLKEFVSTIESKLQLSQQPLLNAVYSIKQDNSVSKTNTDKLFNELNEFLTKYKISSHYKGQVSENMLDTILNKLYPTAQITNTTGQTAAGDFLLSREGKQNIIFENKNYDKNVNIDEVRKFIRDVTENKSHGILLSQRSGIVSKPNWFIEINDSKVLLYLHNVDYDPEKIKTAVEMIDTLSDKLISISAIENVHGINIKKDFLDTINEEFQDFRAKKEKMIQMVKDNYKKMLSGLDDFNMPALEAFLNDKYASVSNQVFICEECNATFTNKRGLASHKKSHNSKKVLSTNENIILIPS